MNKKYCFIFLIIIFNLPGCSNIPPIPEEAKKNLTENVLQEDPCWQHTLNTYGTSTDSMTRTLNNEILDYQSLVEQSLSYRAEIIQVAQRVKENISQEQPLSGSDLDTLNRGMKGYLQLREQLYEVAKSNECWLSSSADTWQELGIEPISSENQLKGIMLSLSAALMLYDNYLLAISVFEEDDKLRRFLNERDPGYGIGQNELAKITESYNSDSKRERVRNALQFYEKELENLSASLQNDPGFQYLKLLMDQSSSYNMLQQQESTLETVSRKVEFMMAMTNDTLRHFASEGVNLFSQFFGNSIGLIETRKGKLYNRPEVLKQLTNQLQAGDILIEKTPFRLTDTFIPGYWGHVGIWIGTVNDLQDLSIWQDPVVKKYHAQIKTEHTVVEALRPGVEMNRLSDFMNIDDLVILRPTNLTQEELAESIILALRQVGKAYDFNFDVETTDKIVCSELVYLVYTKIEWPTEKTLGRFTISPDNVASKALNGGPLELVTFFHDGNLVKENPLELMEQLMIEASSPQ